MIREKFDLGGRVAIVTGAGRGLGKGIALALAEAGANVVCTARTASEIESTASEIQALGTKALAITCDVTDGQAIQDMVGQTKGEFGQIDILVNNAGHSGDFTPLLHLSEQAWENELRVNLTSVFLCAQAVANVMMEKKSGSIINVSSVQGHMPAPGSIGYGAAKAGVDAVTMTMAFELAPYIRVNAIQPGPIVTEGSAPFIEPMKDFIIKTIPCKRLGTLEDIGALALYLASPASDWITGRMFQLDGGIGFEPLAYEGVFPIE